MSGQIGFWDVQDRLLQLSRHGDLLEKLSVTVDFEIFREDLANAAPRDDRSKGGRRRSIRSCEVQDAGASGAERAVPRSGSVPKRSE